MSLRTTAQCGRPQENCENNAVFMLTQCAKACGCREPPPEAAAAIAAARRTSTAGGEPACVDRDKTGACAHWAASGECEANPAFAEAQVRCQLQQLRLARLQEAMPDAGGPCTSRAGR